MNPPIPKLAFVGCGTHSTENLYPMLRYAGAELDAVCDLDRDLAERNARIFGGRSVYTDAVRMLDERRPDGVLVVGPPDLHYRVAKAALSRGIPAFVEKPPAPSLGQARELVALAHAHGTFLMCGFMKRHSMMYREIRRMIDSGEFEPAALRINYSHWAITGLATILPAMSIHAIDLAIALFGEVASVHSTLYETARASSLALTLRFASGRWAQLMLDASQPRIQERLELSGAMDGKNALIVVDNVERMELHLNTHDGTDLRRDLTEINPTVRLDGIRVWRPDYAIPNAQQTRHFVQGFAGEIREFAQAVAQKREAYPGTDDTVKAMAVIDAVVRRPNETVPLA